MIITVWQPNFRVKGSLYVSSEVLCFILDTRGMCHVDRQELVLQQMLKSVKIAFEPKAEICPNIGKAHCQEFSSCMNTVKRIVTPRIVNFFLTDWLRIYLWLIFSLKLY